jgi:hypothetical protein
MPQILIEFSDAHPGSIQNLRRIIEDQWPVIVTVAPNGMTTRALHRCEVCDDEYERKYGHEHKPD